MAIGFGRDYCKIDKHIVKIFSSQCSLLQKEKTVKFTSFWHLCDGGRSKNKQQTWNNLHLKNLYNKQGNSLGARISTKKNSEDFIFRNFDSVSQNECNKVRLMAKIYWTKFVFFLVSQKASF